MTAHTQSAERVEGSAYRTRTGEQLVIRHCRGLAEFEACHLLQRQTWGYPDLEVTPRKSFLLAQELGGQVIAAFAKDGSMVGMVMAMAAFEAGQPGEPPRPYLHSHMLAVAPEFRNHGLGARLKLAQREDALARGIERMTWTFDPLQPKNAYLNIHRLGAIVRRYSPDFYGVSSSRLQSGLPTDRLHAEWWLGSARVEACARAILAEREAPSGAQGAVQQSICLPSRLEEWKQDDAGLERLKALQSSNRELFLSAFRRGLAVTDFNRDAGGDGFFELTLWQPREIQPLRTAHED
jgi:predicted GNAT superfamily acetyltransferase